MKSNLAILSLLFLPVIVFAQLEPRPDPKALVEKLTLEEKARLVVGLGMNMASTGPTVGQTQGKVPGAAGATFAIPQFNIPSTILSDGPAGLRINPTRKDDSKTYYATAFPIATLLASSWDTALVRRVGQAMGNEAKEYGIDLILAPAQNIHRNPLGGRNFEYYSEDPLVSGSMSAAMVNGIESNGVGTSVKHFAANNQETNRNVINTIISERALREIYLRGFEIAVKRSQPWSVMSSYNKLNGKYTSEEYELLTTILRKEWGFKGVVMTDWFGGKSPVEQMKAGNDLLMPGTGSQVKAIMEAVQENRLDIKILDENAARVVAYILATPAYNKYKYSDQPDLKGHAQVARDAAADGMVLLKNNGAALPISKRIRKIAAFGNISYDIISGGSGSGDVNEAYTISLVDGLAGAGFHIDDGLKSLYNHYLQVVKANQPPKKSPFELQPLLPEMVMHPDTLAEKASSDDIALITIGRNSGEFQDRKKDNDFTIRPIEKELIRNVAQAFHAKGKKVIVILNIGGVVETASWRDQVDAILLAWQGGQETGNAIADVLSGKVNPSGKLTTSFPVNYEDVPSASSFPGKTLADTAAKPTSFNASLPAEVTYTEGIYVGYRYYNTFKVEPSFPFGFGLSYTKFTYSGLKLSASSFNNSISASVTITNSGSVAGKEVVELYLAAPHEKMDKPLRELKDFAKTILLNPGQSQTINFLIDLSDLGSYDSSVSSWIAEAGDYTVQIGASSTDIRQSAKFNLPKERLIEKCNKVLVPLVSIEELKP